MLSKFGPEFMTFATKSRQVLLQADKLISLSSKEGFFIAQNLEVSYVL